MIPDPVFSLGPAVRTLDASGNKIGEKDINVFVLVSERKGGDIHEFPDLSLLGSPLELALACTRLLTARCQRSSTDGSNCSNDMCFLVTVTTTSNQ